MPDYVVPDAESLRKMLSVVFGDDLEVSVSDDAALAGRYAATYINDDGAIVAVGACEESLVAFTGAALTMLPKDVADEMATSSNLSDVVVSNFHEIMNICSRLLIAEDGPHLRLDKTLEPGAAAGPISDLESRTSISSFDVTVPGYGGGRISFLVS